MKTLLWIIVWILFIDFIVFCWWKLSGQVAPDQGHLGIITESIIGIIK